ncbi:MAG: hypothetical protein QM722_02450 [Piscinibacter sp.]
MPRLPADWADLLTAGASFRLGSCTRDGRPELCRGLAAQVRADGAIEVLVPTEAGAEVLAAMRDTGHIAVVAALPQSHRSLHMKGRDAHEVPMCAEHGPLFEHCRDAFFLQIEPFGFTREQLMSVWFDIPLEQLSCVRFTPSGAWDQSPGPGAGAPVELLP